MQWFWFYEQEQDLCCCVCSNGDRLGCYAKIEIIFGTVMNGVLNNVNTGQNRFTDNFPDLLHLYFLHDFLLIKRTSVTRTAHYPVTFFCQIFLQIRLGRTFQNLFQILVNFSTTFTQHHSISVWRIFVFFFSAFL